MRLTAGSPLVNDVVILVQYLHHCTRQFVLTGDRFFADLYLGGLVQHLHMGDGVVQIHGELYLFGNNIAVRCRCFNQRVLFACDQNRFDNVCFVGGYPGIHQIVVLVIQFQECTRQFFAGGDVLFADMNGGRCVYHGNHVYAAVLVDRKCDIFSNYIAIRGRHLVQGVGLSGYQYAVDLMCCTVRYPRIDHIVIGISYFQCGSCQFLFAGDVCLADGYLGGIILHFDVCYAAVRVNGKGYILCNDIACRCRCFPERIGFASSQNCFDQMCFFCGYPFFNDVVILVDDLERCTCQSRSGSDVRLADGYLGGIVIHGNHIDAAVGVDGKACICGNHIAVGGGYFMQGIGFTGSQNADDLMCLVCGDPCVNHIALGIQKLHRCSRQFLFTSDFIFCDGNLGGVITHLYSCNAAVCIDLELYVLGNYIAVRGRDFVENVLLSNCQNANDLMFCAVRYPGINDVAVSILDFQCRTSQFLFAGNVFLGDVQFGRIIQHGDFRYLAVCINDKLYVSCNYIAVRGRDFVENVLRTSCQNAGNFMCCAVGYPAVNDIALHIPDFQRCTGNFIFASDVLFGDRYLGGIVLHVNCCDRAVRINRKLHIACQYITVRCCFLVEDVGLSSYQYAFDHVCLVGRCPFVHDVAVQILDLKLCSRQRIGSGDVILCDLYLGLDVVQSNCIGCAVQINRELLIHSSVVASRSSCFPQGVGLTGSQFCGQRMCCAVGDPLIQYILVLVQDLQCCTGKRFPVRINLVYPNNSCNICHRYASHTAVGVDSELLIRRYHIACRSGYLVQSVGLTGDQLSRQHMSRAVCQPFVYYSACLINDLHLRTGKRLVFFRYLVDLYLGGVIIHGNHSHCAVRIDREFYIVGNYIAVCRNRFMQYIGLSGYQYAYDLVGFSGRCPAIQYVVILVPYLQLCTGDFFFAGNVVLADGYSGLCIIQSHFIGCAVCIDCKCDVLCFVVTVRRCCFPQGVGFSGGQFCSQDVCLAIRCPFVYQIAVLVQQL